MDKAIDILKGIHPGAVVERELQKKHLSKRQFALSLNEHPQTIGAITKGRRDMNTPLALKMEQALGMEEGFLMILQVYHDIKKEKMPNQNLTPDIKKFRSAIFWDTDIQKIDWQKQKRAVIRRVFERGNEQEKNTINEFYGKDVVNGILSAHVTSTPPL